jgi:ribonuclease HII
METVTEQIAAAKFTEVLNEHPTEFSDSTFMKASKREELEKFIKENERLVAAVDAAYADLGKQYKWAERRDMRIAFQLNFENPKKYPWQKLDYKKGRQHFFKYRRLFLKFVGRELGMYFDE